MRPAGYSMSFHSSCKFWLTDSPSAHNFSCNRLACPLLFPYTFIPAKLLTPLSHSLVHQRPLHFFALHPRSRSRHALASLPLVSLLPFRPSFRSATFLHCAHSASRMCATCLTLVEPGASLYTLVPAPSHPH